MNKTNPIDDLLAQYERVEHPAHYNWIPGVECWDVAEHFDLNLGNAIKYIWRAPVKENVEAIIDLRKAVFYLEREIELLLKDYDYESVETPGKGP